MKNPVIGAARKTTNDKIMKILSLLGLFLFMSFNEIPIYAGRSRVSEFGVGDVVMSFHREWMLGKVHIRFLHPL